MSPPAGGPRDALLLHMQLGPCLLLLLLPSPQQHGLLGST
jgi:hypothetical protein